MFVIRVEDRKSLMRVLTSKNDLDVWSGSQEVFVDLA